MNSIGIYVVITIIGGLLLYMQIQKLTKKLDEDGAEKGIRVQNGDLAIVQNTSEKYQKFCDSIDARLRELKQSALYDDTLKNEDFKDRFLEELSNISKKLTFVQTMNANTKDAQKWESQIMEILDRIERLVDENFKNPKDINDKIRDDLKDEFQRL